MNLPPLPLIDGCLFVDNSHAMDPLQTCDRLFEYQFLHQRISAGEGTALNFGSAQHLTREFRYKVYKDKPLDQPYFDTCAQILSVFYEEHPVSIDDWRNLNWAKEVSEQYDKRWPKERFQLMQYNELKICDHCEGRGVITKQSAESEYGGNERNTCNFCSGTGKNDMMVELSFALPLYTHGLSLGEASELEKNHPDNDFFSKGIPVFYTGRIDLPILLDGRIWVMDFKTTSMLGEIFWNRMKMSSQQRGYCFSGDTQVLTLNGWVRIDRLPKNEHVAQWSKDGTISFVAPTQYFEKEVNEKLIKYSGDAELLTTADHRLIYRDRQSGLYKEGTAATLPLSPNYRLPCVGEYQSPSRIKTNILLLAAMVQADGHITDAMAVRFHFSKSRKVDRCRENLLSFGVKATESLHKDGTTVFYISNEDPLLKETLPYLSLNKEFGSWLLLGDNFQLRLFLDEVKHWDGSDRQEKGFIYSSASLRNVTWIQTIACLVGRRTSIHQQIQQDGKIQWRANVALARPEVGTGGLEKSLVDFEGKVYCVNVPSSYLLTRRNGVITVAGNCWAFKQLTGKDVAGYIVRAIRTKEPPLYVTNRELSRKGKAQSPEQWWEESLQENKEYVTNAQLEEWKFNTIELIEKMFWQYSRDYFPMSTESCTKYNRCQYFDVCSTVKNERGVVLSSGLYKNNEWSPLKKTVKCPPSPTP